MREELFFPKSVFRNIKSLEKQKESLINLVILHLHQNYQEDKEFLPTSICRNCINKLENHSSESVYQVSVKYQLLVENVKSEQLNYVKENSNMRKKELK